MEWANADLKTLGWENKFDFVFASMCPAVRNVKGFKNMSLASKGYCFLNQFITDKDSLSDYLFDALKIKKGYNPHNDKDSVQAYFNLLWLEGYEPELNYLRFKEKERIPVEEAKTYYSHIDQTQERKQDIDITDLLRPFIKDDAISVIREKTVATILWKVY